jgi:Zn-dependent peptidase ImmA (M78 family)/DNA-binding XRE family transcriptional regulator
MVTPSRIQLARERRGMTSAELARRSGVSPQRLSGYENGRGEPSPATVERIAAALGFPAAFFRADDIEEVPSESVAFRARTKTSKRRQKSVRAAGALAVELLGWLDRRFVLPAPDVPSYGKPEPELAAEMLRARWGLGEAPVPNMVHLLEAHGVHVFSLDPEYDDVDAFSFWRDSAPFVFLSTGKSAERGRFDAAHELGHLVLHGHERPLTGPEAEREANAFASAFLMPRADVLARVPAGAQVDQLLKAKGVWRVSAMALAYRLHDLELLSDWQYRSVCRELAELGFRNGEPGGIARETSQLLAKVLRRLRDNGVTPARIADELHIPTAELAKLMFGLTPTAQPGAGAPDPEPRRPVGLRIVR